MRTYRSLALSLLLFFFAPGCGGGGSDATDTTSDGAAGADVAPETSAPIVCDWPSGTGGVAEGNVLPKSLSWQGYGPGDDTPRTIAIEDFLNCGNPGDLDLLIISTSQYGCARCEAESAHINEKIAEWAGMGINASFIVLLIENPDESSPPKMLAAQTWRDEFELDTVNVAIDGNYSMLATSGGFGTPHVTAVNPRTMEVLKIHQGYEANYSWITSMFDQLGAP
jgi:hypothetical protein